MSPDKQAALEARMESLGIQADDLLEKFVLGSGSGGQKINKTSSCVWLKHVPTGIEIRCQAERSRELNRFLARRELCDRIEGIRLVKEETKRQEIEKTRRQKRRRSRRSKQQSIAEKRLVSKKKSLRRRPAADD